MDAKTLVERLGGEEAVRKMAAFQLQTQILVTPGFFFQIWQFRRIPTSLENSSPATDLSSWKL